MSLQKITKLQDLKDQAKAINDVIETAFGVHRANANKAVLIEMRKHLESNGFSATLSQGKNRGFKASYKGLNISAESSSDEEMYFGADYVIKLTSGTKSAEVSLSIGRIAYPDEPKGTDLDILINEYESEYLPALENASKQPQNNNNVLTYKVINSGLTTNKTIANGKDAIEEFTSLLV